MAYGGPAYWEVIYRLRAVADFTDVMAEAAKAKAALDDLAKSAKAEGDVEAGAAAKAAAAHEADTRAINEEKRALEQLAAAAKLAQVWTEWGGRSNPEAHLADRRRELELITLINRQKWLTFTSPQQAFAWRQNELNQRRLMNYAEWAGYQTADQFLSYLQKQRTDLASLNAVLLQRVTVYRENTDAALAYANALRGSHASVSQLGEGLDLSGINQFQAQLGAIPDLQTTKLEVDDAGAISAIAQYKALLASVPNIETSMLSASQVRGAVPVTGGPVPGQPGAETIPVSYTGPYAEQYAAILAEIAELNRLRAEIPVHFDLPDAAQVTAFVSHLPTVGVNQPVPLVSQGGGAGGGGGPPPVTPAAAAEPPEDAAGKWAALATAEHAEAAASDDAGKSAVALVPKLDLATGSAAKAAGAFGLLQKHFVLFGGLFGSAALIGSVAGWHIALDAIVEALALLVPAIVTATAGLLGWGAAAVRSGQQVYNQMKNVLTVSSALNTVVPPLKGSFQALMDAVRPQVWQLFGDALDVLNGKTGIFQTLIMKTGRVLDEFGARIVVDMQRGGKGLQTFFDAGAKILGMFGQILANLGHAFVGFLHATEITHIAEILLSIVVAASSLIAVIARLPAWLIAAGLAFHGLAVWGGLAATGLKNVALSVVRVAAALGPLNGVAMSAAKALGATDQQLVQMATRAPAVQKVADAFGQNASSIAQFAVAADKSGKSVEELAVSTSAGAAMFGKYGASLDKAGQGAVALAIAAGGSEEQIAKVAANSASAAANTGFFASALSKVGGLAGIATAGLVALAAAAAVFIGLSLTAKDNTQKWVDSINQGLANQSLFTVIGKNVADLAAVTDQLSHSQGLNAASVRELSAEQAQLSGNLGLALPRIGQVSKAYGTDMVGALQLLNLAGVKTSDLFSRQGIVWATDLQMVKGLVDGYKAMGQQIGTIGSDLNVLLVSESDQIKSMQTLNSAWDAWLATVTGGESTFVKVQQDFQSIATAQQTAGASMTGLNKQSLTLRSAFISMVPDAGKVLDAIRAQTATMSSGAAGGALMTRATRDLAAEMIPLAGNSADARAAVLALAQEADPSITTWQKLTKWVGPLGASGAAQDLQGVLFKLAIPVSNLQQDAAKLSSTLQSDLTPAMATAEFNALGGQKAFSTFAADLAKFGPGSQVTVTAGRQVAQMLLSIDKNSGTAKAQFVAWAESMGLGQKQANQLWSEVSKGQQPLESMRKGLASSATASDNLSKSGFFAQRGDTFRTNLQQMGTFFGTTLPHAFETAGKAVASGLGTPLTNFFTKTVPQAAGAVGTFFGGPFRTSVEGAWSHVWSALVSPVVKWTGDIKHAITSGFDSWWKTHGDEVKQVWNAALHQMETDWNTFIGVLKSVGSVLVTWWDGFTGGLRKAWDALTGYLSGPSGSIGGAIKSGIGDVKNVIGDLITWIEAIFKTLWSALEMGFKILWDVVSAAFKIVWDTAVVVVSVALDVITGHWGRAWDDMKKYADQVWNALKNLAIQVWNATTTFAKQAWDNIWGAFNRTIWQPLAHFFGHTVPSWLSQLTSGFRIAWDSTWNNFSHIILSPLTHFFVSTIPGWLNNTGRFFANLWRTVWTDFSGSVLGPVGRWFSSTLPNSIKNGFKGAINWVIDNVINKVINFINNDILKHLPGGLHIGTVGNVASGGDVGAAAGGPFARMAPGSVPGASAIDGTRIMAMGGEYMLRQPARMALEQAYGRGFMNWLNQADTWLSSGSRGTPASQLRRPGVNAYAIGGLVNPIGRGLTPERVDMGVDYGGSGSLYALGSGTITNLWNSGWPGGTFLGLRLNPTYGSGYWYYAEDVIPLVGSGIRVGSAVRAGQHIADATGGPSGIEVGWAAPPGTGETEAAATGQDKLGLAHGDPGAYPTAWGVAASNLIKSLGGPGGIIRGPVQGGTAGIGGAISAIWQSVEGLLDAAGTGLGSLVKPLAKWVSGGASELLKLARQGASAIFSFIWDHTIEPMLSVIPGDALPTAILHGGAEEVKQGILNFLTGQDNSAKSSAASTGGAAIGPVSGPADAGPGQAENYARGQLSRYGWGSSQWPPLQSLWQRESGWSRFARNPSSGAYGIPQALPPTKLPYAGQAAGGSHASPQIDWGLNYIKTRPGYGSPAAAWAHELAQGWYAGGGAVGGDGGWDGQVMAAGGPFKTAAEFRAALAAKQKGEQEKYFGLEHSFAIGPKRYLTKLTVQELGTLARRQSAELAAYRALSGSGFTPAHLSHLGATARDEERTAKDQMLNRPASQGGHPLFAADLRGFLHDLSVLSGEKIPGGGTGTPGPVSGPTPGPTGNPVADWQTYLPELENQARTELTAFWKLMAGKLPRNATASQRRALAAWDKAMQAQQLKTFGLGRRPPGAYQLLSEGFSNPSSITQSQWSAFTGDLATLVAYEEGTGIAGGKNPPGTPRNSGYVAWKYLHHDWQSLLDASRRLAATAKAAETSWYGSAGPGAPPGTPGPGGGGFSGPPTPGPGTAPGGAGTGGIGFNLQPLILGGPGMPVSGSGPDMGFAAGGGLDVVASMFAFGGPVRFTPQVPPALLRQLSGGAGAAVMPRTLSDAAASSGGQRVGLNVESLTINNPASEKPSDSIARASNRLAFFAGRGVA